MTNETEMQSFPLRLSKEEHAALRGYAHATDTSMNDIARRAVREYLAGSARREHVLAAADKFRDQYAIALEKLADS